MRHIRKDEKEEFVFLMGSEDERRSSFNPNISFNPYDNMEEFVDK